MRTIGRKELQDMLEDNEVFTLVDLQPEDGHERIPGSICVPYPPDARRGTAIAAFDRFAARVEELVVDLDEKLVVYGSGCDRTSVRQAARTLEEAGFRNVRVYEGGLGEWLAAGLPVAANVHA